jgi:hypothetical protein
MYFEQLQAHLNLFFERRREILLAYLFGSCAKDRTNKLSDIDIALLVDNQKFRRLDAQKPYGYKAFVIAELMGLLGTNAIDLVLLHEATPLLAHEVVSKGKLLFCRAGENRMRSAFEIQTKYRYFDTKKLRQIQAYYLHKRIQTGQYGKAGDSHGRA